MKKLTSLQILMFMSLTLGSSYILGDVYDKLDFLPTLLSMEGAKISSLSKEVFNLSKSVPIDKIAIGHTKSKLELHLLTAESIQRDIQNIIESNILKENDANHLESLVEGLTFMNKAMTAIVNTMLYMPNDEIQQLVNNLSEKMNITKETAQQEIYGALAVFMMNGYETLMNYKYIMTEKSPLVLDQIIEQATIMTPIPLIKKTKESFKESIDTLSVALENDKQV